MGIKISGLIDSFSIECLLCAKFFIIVSAGDIADQKGITHDFKDLFWWRRYIYIKQSQEYTVNFKFLCVL